MSRVFCVVGYLKYRLLTYRETVNEWVAGILSGTPANGIVISYCAQCVLTASVFTWVATSHVHASLGLFAISANEAFKSAARRDSEITRQTRTGSLIAEFATDAVGSTG